MKKLLTAIAAICILSLAGCRPRTSGVSAPEVSEFTVNQSLKSSARTYLVVSDGDSAYLDISTSMHWPERLGDADLGPLRDSLLRFAYADTTGDVNAAIVAFVTNTAPFGSADEGVTVTPLDSTPADRDRFRQMYSTVNASVTELSEQLISYDVEASSYLGGAHPFSANRPFTYDLLTGRVLTLDNMFLPGSTDALTAIVTSALARQMGIRESQLDRYGIFTSQLTYPGAPWIDGGAIVFHYNTYEIASYASGPIDVTVYPYEVDSLLTPEVRSLFEEMYE